MAEKIYHRSFGRGGGLGKGTRFDVNFSNLDKDDALVQLEMSNDKKILKRKKHDVIIETGKLNNTSLKKKVKKASDKDTMEEDEASIQSSMSSGEVNDVDLVSQDSNDKKTKKNKVIFDEGNKDISTDLIQKNENDNGSWISSIEEEEKEIYTWEEAIKGIERANRVFYFLDNSKKTNRQASVGLRKPEGKFYEITKDTTENEVRGWSSRAMACALEIWHDEAKVELQEKYYKMDPCEIQKKLMKVTKWLNQQDRVDVIDTEIDITGFFHSGTENWEIFSYSKEQLKNILRQQKATEEAKDFFNSATVDSLQNCVFAVRDLLIEQDFENVQGNKMEVPKFSYEVMIKKNVLLKTSVTKNKYDPEDVFKLSSRTPLNEIKKWPETALKSVIKNWRHCLKQPVTTLDVNNMSKTKIEYEVKKIRNKLIKYSMEDYKRRSPRKHSECDEKVEIDFLSNHIEVREKRKVDFHYYIQDEVIQEMDFESMRKLLHTMEAEKAIKVDTLIASISDEKLFGYLLGAKDTLRELQPCYQKSITSMKEPRKSWECWNLIIIYTRQKCPIIMLLESSKINIFIFYFLFLFHM